MLMLFLFGGTVEIKTHLKESGHWYTRNGEPMYTVKANNGQQRNTTLRDARKLDLIPSVTTILNVAAKPGLEAWKQQQILLAALTLPRAENESIDAYAERVIQDSKQQAQDARDLGTDIHAKVQNAFEGGSDNDYSVSVKAILRHASTIRNGSVNNRLLIRKALAARWICTAKLQSLTLKLKLSVRRTSLLATKSI